MSAETAAESFKTVVIFFMALYCMDSKRLCTLNNKKAAKNAKHDFTNLLTDGLVKNGQKKNTAEKMARV